MSVFEDLIVELKEENLLEKTVTESAMESDHSEWEHTVDHQSDLAADLGSESVSVAHDYNIGPHGGEPEHVGEEANENHPHELDTTEKSQSTDEVSLVPEKPSNGREFYKKRAISEVSNLQMVEHVLTGVERQYLKIVPRTFDDFEAKKFLNAFLQVTGDENSAEHAESEFAMMQETESWCTALEERDKLVPVSALRQYCENSRPALSSQALVALARFYRNLPYSETVRAKYDFVITRLFSRPTADQKRICLFSREEMLDHINLLYREWSSVPLYSADEDESKVLLTALSFEELAVEAESVSSFDRLISSDFFGRLRTFKESVSELFFAPNVTAAAIECNIRIGNVYVKLIDAEREKMDEESICDRLEGLDSQMVSEVTGTTLDIVSILRARQQQVGTTSAIRESRPGRPTDRPRRMAKRAQAAESDEKLPKTSLGFLERQKENVRSANRGLVVVAMLLIAMSIGIYFWANVVVSENTPNPAVISVDLDHTILKPHLKTGKISGHNFYGLLQPSWDLLPKGEREEFLQKVYDHVREKGCTQVTLINIKGKAMGFASASKLEVF
jgi:hypothetical protein